MRHVADAMALLRSAVGGELAPIAYVTIREVPGDAWGYDGLTQSDRAATAATRP